MIAAVLAAHMANTLANPFLAGQNNPIERFTFTEIHMGGEFRFTFYAESQTQAEKAAKTAYARIAELEQVMSDYRPNSEIRRLAPNTPTSVSADLYRVLQRAIEVGNQTDGSFDVTAGPAIKLWRNARQTGRMPGPIELRQALKFVDFRKINLNPVGNTVWIQAEGAAIDLGGIAKGDACDQALATLAANGIKSALIQAGGDIRISSAPPDSEGWMVQIPGEPSPRPFTNCSIATSGDTEQFVEIDGVRYSHIVDPRTGMGLTNRVMATVIAPTGLESDPLATAFCVLGRDSAALAKRLGVQLVLTENASQPHASGN